VIQNKRKTKRREGGRTERHILSLTFKLCGEDSIEATAKVATNCPTANYYRLATKIITDRTMRSFARPSRKTAAKARTLQKVLGTTTHTHTICKVGKSFSHYLDLSPGSKGYYTWQQM